MHICPTCRLDALVASHVPAHVPVSVALAALLLPLEFWGGRAERSEAETVTNVCKLLFELQCLVSPFLFLFFLLWS